MIIPGVITDEPWRWNDSWPLENSVDEREIHSTELVDDKSVDIECIRQNDRVSLAIIETERRS